MSAYVLFFCVNNIIFTFKHPINNYSIQYVILDATEEQHLTSE